MRKKVSTLLLACPSGRCQLLPKQRLAGETVVSRLTMLVREMTWRNWLAVYRDRDLEVKVGKWDRWDRRFRLSRAG